jgi:hypothetical protein
MFAFLLYGYNNNGELHFVTANEPQRFLISFKTNCAKNLISCFMYTTTQHGHRFVGLVIIEFGVCIFGNGQCFCFVVKRPRAPSVAILFSHVCLRARCSCTTKDELYNVFVHANLITQNHKFWSVDLFRNKQKMMTLMKRASIEYANLDRVKGIKSTHD